MEKQALQKYVSIIIDTTNGYLKSKGTRLLTDAERKIVLEYLLEVADSYDPATSKARDLETLLCLEAARKVSEVHPDMETPTEEQIANGEARVSKEFDRVLNQSIK